MIMTGAPELESRHIPYEYSFLEHMEVSAQDMSNFLFEKPLSGAQRCMILPACTPGCFYMVARFQHCVD